MKNNSKQIGYKPADQAHFQGLLDNIGLLSVKAALDHHVQEIKDILESLTGINAILESNDINFDTLQEIVDSLKNKSDKTHNHDTQYYKKGQTLDIEENRIRQRDSGSSDEHGIRQVFTMFYRYMPDDQQFHVHTETFAYQSSAVIKLKVFGSAYESAYTGYYKEYSLYIRFYQESGNNYTWADFDLDKAKSLGSKASGYMSLDDLEMSYSYDWQNQKVSFFCIPRMSGSAGSKRASISFHFEVLHNQCS